MPGPRPLRSCYIMCSGDGSDSTSAIVSGVSVDCSHVLKIVSYSRTKHVPNGRRSTRHFHREGTQLSGVSPQWMRHPTTRRFHIVVSRHPWCDASKGSLAQSPSKILDRTGSRVSPYTKVTGFMDFMEKGSWGYQKFIERKARRNPKHLVDDSSLSTVRRDRVLRDIQAVGTPPVVVSPSDMHRHYGDLLA
ncbi:unnamed protein product [Miscanthus lutarioriparius]|uniref:Uncharacterized protein n=1 Tax=Miscanthus lutarioriparius TaxID=422564 RepID=A0A811SNX0_9POAL|nr:unnamed protein product [Miscanthus lutarioriparius]